MREVLRLQPVAHATRCSLYVRDEAVHGRAVQGLTEQGRAGHGHVQSSTWTDLEVCVTYRPVGALCKPSEQFWREWVCLP